MPREKHPPRSASQSRFPSEGLVRLSAILAPVGPVPVSRSTWFAGVKSGRFPKPVKLGPRITAWHVSDILRLINVGFTGAGREAGPAAEDLRQ
jgi:prophage regulatory protein